METISWNFNEPLQELTVFIDNGETRRSIANVNVCDRDIDEDEDTNYFQNLAEEVAFELGYLKN